MIQILGLLGMYFDAVVVEVCERYKNPGVQQVIHDLLKEQVLLLNWAKFGSVLMWIVCSTGSGT